MFTSKINLTRFTVAAALCCIVLSIFSAPVFGKISGAIYTSVEDGGEVEIRLGHGESTQFQAIVPPGHWQEAEALQGDAGYALVGCVVAPGFEFEDFEMAAPSELRSR